MQKFTRETLLRFNFVSSPLASPEGRYLAYRQTRADADAGSYRSRIYLYDHERARAFALTAEAMGGLFCFENENSLLFTAEREGASGRLKADESLKAKTQCYRIALDGGEAELCAELDFELERLVVLDEGRWLIQVKETRQSRALRGLEGAELAEAEQLWREDADYEVLEQVPFWLNGEGYTGGRRSRLYLFDPLKSEYKALSAADASAELLDVKADGSTILFREEAEAKVYRPFNRLYLCDLNTLEQNEISLPQAQDFAAASFAGEDILFVSSDLRRYGLNEDGCFYLLESQSERPRLLSEAGFIHNSLGTDVVYGSGRPFCGCSEGVYFIATEGESSYVKFLDKSGRQRRVCEQAGAVTGLALYEGADGRPRLYISAMRGLNAAEIYAVEEGGERQLSEANPWLKDYALSVPERLSFRYHDDELCGFVLKPLDFQSGGRYPGLLTIHGGPKTVFGELLHHEMQMLAAAGFFVFYTNPRGSDGRGREWADIRGRYGRDDYAQLMALTDAVLERYPELDAARLGVLGGSYGGFMTNWVIGHSQRFAAACTQRSIANWFSMYGVSDIGYYFTEDQCGADPWTDAAALWAQSPLKYAPQMRTPTLIIHSDEDYRCPLAEGQQLFTALLCRGVPARMVVFKGENHELSRSGRPAHRQRRLREILDWFTRYLQPSSFKSEGDRLH